MLTSLWNRLMAAPLSCGCIALCCRFSWLDKSKVPTVQTKLWVTCNSIADPSSMCTACLTVPVLDDGMLLEAS